MINEESMTMLDMLPDKLEAADTKVYTVLKLMAKASNPDHIMKAAAACSLAFNSALSLAMGGNGTVINELPRLHTINRVLCATNPYDDTKFATKWKRIMRTPKPSTRNELFKELSFENGQGTSGKKLASPVLYRHLNTLTSDAWHVFRLQSTGNFFETHGNLDMDQDEREMASKMKDVAHLELCIFRFSPLVHTMT
ncbi:hypothetical protein PsorP6_016587 [Peronosclerospora sorghi]|uniref:Uncharacterized protein n=1 Tax=Peronosclerospora sorghi TaxID=230839 RepID=A0ACC0VJ39_9STRA|nr:hypothetical protein PsorP6_016587 [Peronosclerospora sorghi]